MHQQHSTPTAGMAAPTAQAPASAAPIAQELASTDEQPAQQQQPDDVSLHLQRPTPTTDMAAPTTQETTSTAPTAQEPAPTDEQPARQQQPDDVSRPAPTAPSTSCRCCSPNPNRGKYTKWNSSTKSQRHNKCTNPASNTQIDSHATKPTTSKSNAPFNTTES